jgi:phosphoribosylformimino-5-aminoimidazole carboxamide ribotide isomerase
MTRRPIEAIPAIDLIDGQCVRLMQGDYSRKTVYGLHPEETALQLEQAGFERLHVVDLDGARAGHTVNIDVLRRITSSTRLKVDFGGGVKTEADVVAILDAGAQMVTIGSLAVTRPELVTEWASRYGAERLIIGADVRGDKISIHGWQEDSQTTLDELLNYYTAQGVSHFLCTDISRDGMLQGPATALYQGIMEKYPSIHLIASGGISCTDDILALEAAGIPAVVFGKAYYEGRIDPEKILRR